MSATNILFLYTGNSCRSQMVESWLRDLGGDRFVVQSAGIVAHEKNLRAIAGTDGEIEPTFRMKCDEIHRRAQSLIDSFSGECHEDP